MNQLHLLKLTSIMLLFVSSVTDVNAQAESASDYDFDYPADSSGWQNSDNKSQLFRSPVKQAGRALVSYQFENGSLTDFNTAHKTNRMQAMAESYIQLSPATMVYGLASFDSYSEKEVSGSAFLSEREHAFNLVFMDGANKGMRKTESYRIGAAIGHQLLSRVSVGAKFDYKGINMARTKDLRHTNKVLDLNFAPSVSLSLSKRLATGIHYNYNRFIEGIKFNQYGTTDQQYFTLIDFGAFYGKQELFDQNGYTAKGAETPYVEQIHTLGWQIEYKPTERLSLFNEFDWGTGNGYFGKKGSNAIQYTQHEISLWRERLWVGYISEATRQKLEIELAHRSLTNYENSWRSETSSSGNGIIEYYGKNQTGTRDYTSLKGGYSIDWGKREGGYKWQLLLESAYQKNSIHSIIYPYYRTQALNLFSQRIQALHHCSYGSADITLKAAFALHSGSGTPYSEGVFVTPSSEQGMPAAANEYLMQQYNYLTALKAAPEVGLRIALPIKNIRYYLKMAYKTEFGLQQSEISGNRHNVSCALGINF